MALACRVAHVIPGGDHMIVTGAVDESVVDDARRPLVYHRRRLAPLNIIAGD